MKAYLSLIKFSHTVFALPFAVLAFFLGLQADGSIWNGEKLMLVLLCMVFARSAAMAFNRYADRHVDALNARTRVREIPAGVISPGHALGFAIFMSAAFITATWWINPLCFVLSPVALAIVLGYSYTKRFTWLCHMVLGMGLGLAPVGAYLAVTGRFDVLPVLYGIMVMCWVSGFDILYALQDEEFDRAHGLHSIPQRFGSRRARGIALVLHGTCAILLIGITWLQAGQVPALGWLHIAGAAGFIALLVRQHYLVHTYGLKRIDQAFFETNGIASLLFGAAVVVDLLSPL